MVRSELALPQNAPVDRAKSIESPSSQVLASFQIQRTGQQVRIVDADGSDYEGQVVESVIVGLAEKKSPLQQRMQTAPQQMTLSAGKDTAGQAGAASTAQGNISGGNSQALRNGSVNSPANAGESPLRPANNDAVAQNLVSATGVDGATLAGQQQTGAGSGFAFQVSGVSLRLNQAVTIIGNCSNLYYQSNPNTQNAAPAGQIWRVTGQVQVGPATHFGLDASTVTP